jgi:hypothetical protein
VALVFVVSVAIVERYDCGLTFATTGSLRTSCMACLPAGPHRHRTSAHPGRYAAFILKLIHNIRGTATVVSPRRGAHPGRRRASSLLVATVLGCSLVACGESEEDKATERDAKECHAILEGDVPKDDIAVAVAGCVMAKRLERDERVDPGGPP